MSVKSLYKMAFVLSRKLYVSESHLGGMRLSLKIVMLAFYLETSGDSAFPPRNNSSGKTSGWGK